MQAAEDAGRSITNHAIQECRAAHAYLLHHLHFSTQAESPGRTFSMGVSTEERGQGYNLAHEVISCFGFRKAEPVLANRTY
jgi:hypothetical protein